MGTAQALVNPPAEASPDTQCCRRCPTPLLHERHPEPREGWRPHFGRGLCEPCWKDAKAKDELVDYERSTRTRDEVLDEWDFLRRAGVTRREAAERIGVRLDSLDRQICRARRAGDPRAVYGTRGPAPITKEKETHDMNTSDTPPSWLGGTADTNPPRSSPEQRIERLQDLGDQRTERQTALMNRAMENKAAAARTDALDRQWDDTCGRDDCGEDSNGRPTYRSVDAPAELLCDRHAMEPTEMDAASVGAYWDVIADGGSADEATAAAASRQIEQDRAREAAGRAWQRETVTGDERVSCDV